jgi:hypothetical protein
MAPKRILVGEVLVREEPVDSLRREGGFSIGYFCASARTC